MASTLTITGCIVETTSITLSFSDAFDPNPASGSTGALNRENYSIYSPALPGFSTPTSPDPTWSLAADPADPQSVVLGLPAGLSLDPGDVVLIIVTNIALAADPGVPALEEDPSSFSREVPGSDSDNTARTTRNVEDAVSYPILTEEIGYRPSPVGIPTGGGGGNFSGGGGGGSSVGQVALRAVSDVLGWKANTTDPKGFIGALTQSFTLTDVEGHVESSWTPRTYAVQTDLGGGITGAQASLYTRAKDALDQCLSLLDGLYPLDPEADPEYVKALREMARSQMTEIVKEFGVVGLPSILRINTYFDILIGQHDPQVIFDPDAVTGTLGTLRDTYGINFTGNRFNNSVEDEQDITNFRVISDYMTSLLQSWIANRDFFRLASRNPAFFGTQLVLISRQFNVIIETVNEVRFTLDSVFIGPNERQTLLIEFDDAANFPPMFLEDVLVEVEKFATEEGPRLLRDGGKISVTNNLLPVVDTLAGLIDQAHRPANDAAIPDGYRTARVQKSLDDLEDQLAQLVALIEQVQQQVPPAEDRLSVDSISLPQEEDLDPYDWVFSIFGDGFDPDTGVDINSPTTVAAEVEFFSAQRIDAKVDSGTWATLAGSSHSVTVTNPDGESIALTNAFAIDAGGNVTLSARRSAGALKGMAAKLSAAKAVGPRAARPTPTLGTGRGTSRPGARVSKPVARPAKAVSAPSKGGGGTGAATPTTPSPAVAALHRRIDDLQQGHENMSQKLDDMWGKMKDFFESKSKDKDKKDKGD